MTTSEHETQASALDAWRVARAAAVALRDAPALQWMSTLHFLCRSALRMKTITNGIISDRRAQYSSVARSPTGTKR